MTTRKILLTVGLLAAVGIGFWAVKGWPPVGRGEQGAIGAANRYSAQQMSDADVVLGDDAVASLLQDDVFLELIADPDFQSLLAHSEAMDMLARGGTPELLAHQDPISFLSRDRVADILGRSDVGALLRNDAFTDYMSRTAISDGNGKGHKTLDRASEISDLLARNNIELGAKGVADGGLGKNEIVNLLAREDWVQMLGRQDVQTLARTEGFADALGRSGIADGGKGPKSLQRAEALEALAKQNNIKVLGARGVPADALGRNEAVDFLSRNDVADVLGRSDVGTLMRNSEFGDLMRNASVSDATDKGKGHNTLDRAEKIKDILSRNNIELGAKGVADGGLGRNEIAEFLARDEVVQVLGRNDVQGLMRSGTLADALGRASVADGGKGPKALDRATKIKDLMAKSDVQMVGRSGVADGSLGRQSDKVKALLANPKVADLLSRQDVTDYFGRGSVKDVMARTEVQGLFRADHLANTLGRLQVSTEPGKVKDKGGK